MANQGRNADTEDKQPHPVDLVVGNAIRARRKLLGVSQEALADKLGLTFQQVQKYERGANRVSSSKLYEIAKALQTPIASFFVDLDDPIDGAAATGNAGITAFATIDGSHEIAGVYCRLTRGRRKVLLATARALGEEDGDNEDLITRADVGTAAGAMVAH